MTSCLRPVRSPVRSSSANERTCPDSRSAEAAHGDGGRRGLGALGNRDLRRRPPACNRRSSARSGFERAARQRDARVNVHLARQPHARERLAHRHRRADVVDFDQPAAGQKVHPDVVERVFDDLVLGGIDPERDERGLVHLALDAARSISRSRSAAVLLAARPSRFLASVASAPAFPCLCPVVAIVEHARRVVLDAQHLLPLELVRGRRGSSFPART